MVCANPLSNLPAAHISTTYVNTAEGTNETSFLPKQAPGNFTHRKQSANDRRFGATNYPAASANQNARINISYEKPEEWTPCFPYKLKLSNGAKDCLISNKFFKLSHGADSLTTRDTSCNQTKKTAVI